MGKVALILLITLGTVSGIFAGTVFEETYEKKSKGDACWKAYYVRGKSFAGATDTSASPFDGGMMSYRLYRFPKQKNGWAILRYPVQEKGPATIEFDVMVPEGSQSSLSVMDPDWKVWIVLSFDAKNQKMTTSEGARHQGFKNIELMELKPHRWYRIVIEIPVVSAKSETFNLTVYEQQYNGKEPVEKKFENLRLYTHKKGSRGSSLGMFKIGGMNPDIYIDNLKVTRK
jgi:hypothetical protein